MKKQQRLITLDGSTNFRDLGGYLTKDKKTVRWQKIYRSDSLSSLSLADQQKLTELKIVVDCDLRSTNEQKFASDKLWNNVKYIDAHIYSEDDHGEFIDEKRPLYKFLHHVPKVDNYLGKIYQDVTLSKTGQQAFAKVFSNLLTLSDDQALVFHCSAGKDRTGMTAALILMGLGVPEKTIIQDYLLTNELYHFGLSKKLPSDSEMLKLVNKMNVTTGEGDAVKGITRTIEEGFGGFENYFIKILGFTKKDLKEFRKRYLE